MSTPNFSSILDESPTEVATPKPLPVGTYLGRVVGQPRYDKSSKKKTDFVEFKIKLLEASEDVDPDELQDCLGDGVLTDRMINATYYLTPEAIFRLDQFHVDCGLDLQTALTRGSRNEEVINQEVMVVMRHETSEDGKQTYARLARTMAA